MTTFWWMFILDLLEENNVHSYVVANAAASKQSIYGISDMRFNS